MELGRPYEAALALADIATEPALRRSLELLTDLGARATAAVVTRRLRALGARDIPRGPRPTTLVNPAELTPREVEIVQLLADGLRNAEIAERLFLSRAHRREPRLVDPAQARRAQPCRGGRGRAAARRPPRRVTSQIWQANRGLALSARRGRRPATRQA